MAAETDPSAWQLCADPAAEPAGPVVIALHIALVPRDGVRCAIAVAGMSKWLLPVVELVHTGDDPRAAITAAGDMAARWRATRVVVVDGSLTTDALGMFGGSSTGDLTYLTRDDVRAAARTWANRLALRGMRHRDQPDLAEALARYGRGVVSAAAIAAQLALHSVVSIEETAAQLAAVPAAAPPAPASDAAAAGGWSYPAWLGEAVRLARADWSWVEEARKYGFDDAGDYRVWCWLDSVVRRPTLAACELSDRERNFLERFAQVDDNGVVGGVPGLLREPGGLDGVVDGGTVGHESSSAGAGCGDRTVEAGSDRARLAVEVVVGLREAARLGLIPPGTFGVE